VFESNHLRTGINYMTIRMHYWPLICTCDSFYGGIEHRVDQFRIWSHSDRPADDHTIEAVDDGREIYLASRDMEFSDIGQPFLV